MVYLVWPALEPGLDENKDMVDTLVHCWILDGKQPEERISFPSKNDFDAPLSMTGVCGYVEEKES